jgi:hypothetical protein
MSKQVDVLAELDRRIEIGELFGQEHGAPNLPGVASLREARAAIAELIEANVAFSAATDAMMKSPNDKNGNSTVALWHVANDRRSAALARCNGGAA